MDWFSAGYLSDTQSKKHSTSVRRAPEFSGVKYLPVVDPARLNARIESKHELRPLQVWPFCGILLKQKTQAFIEIIDTPMG
jgi:hypothetical protein